MHNMFILSWRKGTTNIQSGTILIKIKRNYLICNIENTALVLPVPQIFSGHIFYKNRLKSMDLFCGLIEAEYLKHFGLFLKYSGLTTDFKPLMPRTRLNCAGHVVHACCWKRVSSADAGDWEQIALGTWIQQRLYQQRRLKVKG